MFAISAGKTLNLPYIIYACGRVGVCVHIHTDYMYGRWSGAWNTNLVFLNTDFIFSNTYFIFYEHEFYFFWTRISLTDFLKCEGGMIWWKEYLDGTVFWKKKWILVGKKNRILVGKKKGILVEKRKDFSRENRWNFHAQKWIFMQSRRRKCINIQNSDCKQNKRFCLLFSKMSRELFTIFVNNS